MSAMPFVPNSRLITYICFVLTVWVSGCQSDNRILFENLAESGPDEKFISLYLLRPYNSIYSLNSLAVQVATYPDNDTANEPKLLNEFLLDNGEFLCLQYGPGLYRINLPDYAQNYTLIELTADRQQYVAFVLHSTSFFSKSLFLPKQIDKESAVAYLLQYGHMFERSTTNE
ncbi:MAG: hypothetical protein KDK39_17775 [Leptospiraceae bacterium]|nr:hypothetical protein [Leptospiraceae bacterium]